MTLKNKIIAGIATLFAAGGITYGIVSNKGAQQQNFTAPVQTVQPQTAKTIAGVGTVKYATRNGDGSVGYPSGIVSGDTIYIPTGDYTSAYMGNKTFNPAVVIRAYTGEVRMTNGFAFDNVSGVIVDGTGIPGVKYGFKITGRDINRDVALSVFNLGSFVEFKNIEVSHIMSAVWIKDEQKCSQNYPNGFFHYNIHDCYFHNCGLDMLYIGSTDPYGTARSIVCSGNTIRPRPARVGDIWIHNNIFDTANRQVLQINNCDTLGALVENNILKHSGFGMGSNQGVLLFYGQGTQNTITRNNTFISSWQHNLWSYAYGNNQIYNNTFDSSGIVPGGTNYSENPIVISGVYNSDGSGNPQKGNFNIQNNTIGSHSSDPDKNDVWIDNSKGYLNLSGNTICNSGKVYNPQSVPYTNNCAPPSADSTTITVSVTHDTIKLVHFDTTFRYVDTVIRKLRRQTSRFKDGTYIVRQVFDSVGVDTTIRYIVRLPYDSLVLLKNGATHDSTYNVAAAIAYGVFLQTGTVLQRIDTVKNYFWLKWIRYGVTTQSLNYVTGQYQDSGIKVALGYNYRNPNDAEDFPSPGSELNTYSSVLRGFLTTRKPDLLSLGNELTNLDYWTNGQMWKVVKMLDSAYAIGTAFNVPMCVSMYMDLTFPLNKYYRDNGKTDSLTWLQNITGNYNPANDMYQQKNARYDTLFTWLAAHNSVKIDIHWYETFPQNAANYSGLFKTCLNFGKFKTGCTSTVSLEFGVNTGDDNLIALLNDMKSQSVSPQLYYAFDGDYPRRRDMTYINYTRSN